MNTKYQSTIACLLFLVLASSASTAENDQVDGNYTICNTEPFLDHIEDRDGVVDGDVEIEQWRTWFSWNNNTTTACRFFFLVAVGSLSAAFLVKIAGGG